MGRHSTSRPHTGRYESGSVIETRVAAHDLDYGLTTLRFDGGELIVPQRRGAGRRTRARAHSRARRFTGNSAPGRH